MKNYARIAAVASYFPEATLTNAELSEEFPQWSVEKIAEKTGIRSRHIANGVEFSSDLATGAGKSLFEDWGIAPTEVEYLIVCTQSPDFFLPSTATIVQHNLGLLNSVGAIDVNLGCSGYVYSLGLAKGLIESGQVANVLVVTADTWSKYINPGDKSVRTIFGDGATATLVRGDSDTETMTGFVYGTDGGGAGDLIVPRGGIRSGEEFAEKAAPDARGLIPSDYDLYMDGPSIFNFTLGVVPTTISKVLERTKREADEVDYFVFHQANRFMLEHLRTKLGIAESKFPVVIEECGNTISSTIPIVLEQMIREGKLSRGTRTMLMGFGVGLSWAGAMIDWTDGLSAD